jgi:hypothetical protein
MKDDKWTAEGFDLVNDGQRGAKLYRRSPFDFEGKSYYAIAVTGKVSDAADAPLADYSFHYAFMFEWLPFHAS